MNLPKLEDFKTHQQDDFSITFTAGQEGVCQVKEISVSKAPANEQGKQQFSVVFVHNNPVVFEQGVYSVKNRSLGAFDLFLVPIYGDEEAVHYEAVFT